MFKKRKKILAAKRPNNYFISTTDLHTYVNDNLSFLDFDKKLPRSKSIVVPYILCSDSKYILSGLDETGNLYTGFASVIYKPSWGPFTRSGFNQLTTDKIFSDFFDLYGSVEVKEFDGTRILSKKDVQLVETGHTITNLDQSQLFPIYMMSLNPKLTMKFPSEIDNIALISLDKQNLQNHSIVNRLSLTDRQVSFLLTSDHINLGDSEGF